MYICQFSDNTPEDSFIASNINQACGELADKHGGHMRGNLHVDTKTGDVTVFWRDNTDTLFSLYCKKVTEVVGINRKHIYGVPGADSNAA